MTGTGAGAPGPAVGRVYSCSPRAGGNSDAAARAFAQGATETGGEVRLLALRERTLLACRGCQACAEPPHACPLMRRDEAEAFFAELLAASYVCFAAPIYFYHLPGFFKGLVDRAQRYFAMAEAGHPLLADLAPRPAFVILAAGRPRGEKLFEGSLLTLKYFLKPFRLTMAEPLLLRGKDAPGDLAADPAALAAARELGRQAVRAAGGAD